MKKQDLIRTVAEKAVLSKVDTEAVIDALLETIKEAVLDNDSVNLGGFGSFSPALRPARSVRNPRTGEAIELKETRVVKFKVSKTFKEQLSTSHLS